MRPIVKFVGRDCLQDVPGQVVLNFEALLVELQRGRERHYLAWLLS